MDCMLHFYVISTTYNIKIEHWKPIIRNNLNEIACTYIFDNEKNYINLSENGFELHNPNVIFTEYDRNSDVTWPI